MRFSRVLPWASTLLFVTAEPGLTHFDIRQDLHQLDDAPEVLQLIQSFWDLTFESESPNAKRDLESTVQNLAITANQLGVIWQVLDSLYENPNQVDLIGTIAGNALKGLGVFLNSGSLAALIDAGKPYINQVFDLGLIQGLASYLFSDQNLNITADSLGNLLRLPNSTWFSQLLLDIGDGQGIHMDHINWLILNKKSAYPETANNIVTDSVFGNPNVKAKRADDANGNYTGSLQQFLGNIVSLVGNSNVLANSVGAITGGLAKLGVLGPILLRVLNTTEYSDVLGELILAINATGALNIDVNTYFDQLKKLGVMSDGVQFIISDPTVAPPLGLFFQRLELTGAYHDVQQNLYGPSELKN